jgi:hypothetical protein
MDKGTKNITDQKMDIDFVYWLGLTISASHKRPILSEFSLLFS